MPPCRPPALALAVALAAACGGGAGAVEPPRHVVVIVVDTLRADALGCYGGRDDLTPVIDGLAERGVLFECTQTPSTWTIPATVSLLSGMTPFEHGTTTQLFNRIPDDVPLVAEALEDAGFRGAAVVCNPLMEADHGFARGFDSYEKLDKAPADEAVDAALDWVRGTAPDEERLFLYLHLFDPHWPYEPAEAERVRLALPPSPIPMREQEILGRGMMAGDPEATAELLAWCDWATVAYEACVASVDREIGRLMDGLDERGILADSVVVVTADHGEEFGENGAIGHARQLFSETLNVPLVIAGPGVPIGERFESPVPLRGLPGTVLAAAGVEPTTVHHRVDLIDEDWREGVSSEDHHALLHFGLWPKDDGTFRRTYNLVALRRGDRRVLWSFDDAVEDGEGRLMELGERLVETGESQLGGDEAGAEMLSSLEEAWRSSRRPESLKDATAVDERRMQLEELGYGGD
ncbi:MAG: sulfatase, partial [Planctomycetota bacterium]